MHNILNAAFCNTSGVDVGSQRLFKFVLSISVNDKLTTHNYNLKDEKEADQWFDPVADTSRNIGGGGGGRNFQHVCLRCPFKICMRIFQI